MGLYFPPKIYVLVNIFLKTILNVIETNQITFKSKIKINIEV